MQRFVEIPYQEYFLRGMQHLPDRHGTHMPFVLFFHGFTGTRVEAHRLFYHLSGILEKEGIASLRFDFLGSGESDGDYSEMTVTSLVEQAMHVLQWTEERFRPSQLFVIGFSLGGLVASLVAERSVQVCKVVLISPGRAACIIKRYEDIFSKNRESVVDILGHAIGQVYYQDLAKYLNSPSRFYDTQEIFVVHGTGDLVTSIEYGREFMDIPGGIKRMVEVSGADHIYSSLEWQRLILQEVPQFLLGDGYESASVTS